MLTVDQRRWLDLKGRIKLAQPLHIPPRPESSKFRCFIFDITQHKNFKRFSAFLVLLNCGLLSVPWKVDVLYTKPLATLAAIFTFLFLIEAAMKAIALGSNGYWQSRRNRFDLFVTFLGLIWIIMHFVSFGKKELAQPSNSFGFVVIVLRFFTIAGKHVFFFINLTLVNNFNFFNLGNFKNAYAYNYCFFFQKFFYNCRHVSAYVGLCLLWCHLIWLR